MFVSDLENKGLEKQALSLLNSGKYKEATELYKKLLQHSDNIEWRNRLAFCYLQRAKAFAQKRMFKEAMVLWENYRQHGQPPYADFDRYLIWLIQTKNPANVRTALQQLTAQQLDKDYPELASVLGLLILTEHPEFQEVLPQDSAFIAHVEIAKTVLQAYRAHNPERTEAALKPLPYRSAFRDLRTLMKAAIAASTSIEAAQPLLEKIPTTSPYAHAAQLLFACTLKGAELANKMLRFTSPERRLIGEIIGLNKQQLEFLDSLNKQKDRLSDKIKFNLAIQFQSLCGSELAQRFCDATLMTYPAGRRTYEKAFGPMDEFEANRLKALAYENQNNRYDAEFFWKQAIKALPKEGTDTGLKVALILRHIASTQPPSEQIASLIASLEHDPGDKDCYLQILDHYGQQPDATDAYKQWLDNSLDRFPRDTEVLTRAIQAAMSNKAYKKAIHYASIILENDPLNTFAKRVIFSCRLDHARRLIKTKKYQLVEPEIQQAEALKLGKNDALQTQLLRSLLGFATGTDKKQGLQAVAEAMNKLDPDPVTAHFQAAVEAQMAGLPVATILRELPATKDRLLSEQALTRLIHLLTQYGRQQSNRELLHKALEKIKAPLKQSVLKQSFEEKLLLALCQALDAIEHFELLRHCAKQAQAKWHNPIWMYYRVHGETNGDPGKISYMHRFRLMAALDQAAREKDHRARVLIERYLERYHQTLDSPGLDFFDSSLHAEQEEPAKDVDPFDQLFGHLPDEIFYRIDKKADALVKKTSPERLIEELTKVTGNDRNLFFAMMQDPDLFSALMIVKAANELSLDIGVSYEDVLKCFDVEKVPRSLPFPF